MDYNIKVYDVRIDGDDLDDLGVYETSLVSSPAMKEEFVALSTQINLSLDNDKQILIGAALVPDRLVYRVNPETKEEFYIKFSKETIEKIAQRFFKNSNQLNFNVEHSDKKIKGYAFESWLTTENDKAKTYGFYLPEGTWMLSTKIEDKEDWDKYVKSGQVKGYSIEGNFDLILQTNEKFNRASNVVIIADFDTLSNKRVQDYLSVMSTKNRIVIFSETNVNKRQIQNQFGFIADDVYVNDYGRDQQSKLAWRGIKAAELQSKFNVIQYITKDNRVANMAKQLNIRKTGTSLSLSPNDVKELMTQMLSEIELESYNDYPQAARDNAERGIRYNEEQGNKCATQVGKVRAQQISKGEALSYETLKRTFSYLSRAKEYYKPNDKEACGTISFLLWGGEEMLNYVERKLKQIDDKKN